jgi:MATE family multidrug resistance protein
MPWLAGGVGVPLAWYLAFKAGMGVHGLWTGIFVGDMLQAVVLSGILLSWNWHKEVERVQKIIKEGDGGAWVAAAH